MNSFRRAAFAAAAAVAATLYGAVGGAAAATPATVSGSGTVGTGYNPIAFTIDASGVGPDATGTVHYEQGQSVITGHVVCLAASPTDAEIVTQIDSSTVPAGEGGAVGNAMQIDVFALLAEARQRIASTSAAIEAEREFWLAETNLGAALLGGNASPSDTTASAAAAPESAGGH